MSEGRYIVGAIRCNDRDQPEHVMALAYLLLWEAEEAGLKPTEPLIWERDAKMRAWVAYCVEREDFVSSALSPGGGELREGS